MRRSETTSTFISEHGKEVKMAQQFAREKRTEISLKGEDDIRKDVDSMTLLFIVLGNEWNFDEF